MESIQYGWGVQIFALTLAYVLSALIGLEREFRHKSAGLRTCTIVGFASALMMLVSKYGFNDMIGDHNVSIDPSRVAAQIVSGIGFIGGGVIFMRRDIVQGLTTAASVWLTAGIGMACGSGLFGLALFVTIGHFVAMLIFPRFVRGLRKGQWIPVRISVTYRSTPGLLGEILARCTALNFIIERVNIDKSQAEQSDRLITVSFSLRGEKAVADLTNNLSEMDGIVHISSGDDDDL